MKDLERQLINCLAAYRSSRKPAAYVGLNEADWPDLYRLARIHKLGAVVWETLWGLPDFCAGNTALAALWKRETILETAAQTQRTHRLLTVTQALERGGIPYAVVKGAVCRALYAEPDLRPSGDEDILIDAADREQCGELLRAEGLELLEVKEGDPVTHWGDRQTGLHIELHTALMPGSRAEDKLLNQYFSGQLACTVTAQIQDRAVKTLHPTSHFLFLVCHALKHFIYGGFGIRTVCDVVTYAERYAQEIDKESVYSRLETVRGRIFLDQLFAIGRDFLEFDLAESGWTLSAPPDAGEMLEDILDAGIYGQSSMSRRHSAGLVAGAAEHGSHQSSTLSVVFPSQKHMTGKYPVLKQAPVLLPACWVHRLGKYAVEVLRTRKAGNSPLESVAMGKKRTEMMVKYGVLPKGQTKN